MKKTLLAVFCSAFLAWTATTVVASDWSVSGNVALTSDYVYRGFTQSDAGPAIQGGLDLNHTNGLFAGFWSSSIESDPGAPYNFNGSSLELDVYFGWYGKIIDSSLELTATALRLFYPGTNTSANNSNDFSLYVRYDLGRAAVKGGVAYSDDSYGTGEAWYWDVGIDIPAGPTTISLQAGRSDFDASDDYTDYSIGISGEAIGLGLSLTYTGTNGVSGDCATRTCDDRAVFAISRFI
jgi:uncharacterized protein (TIGR02001 family)